MTKIEEMLAELCPNGVEWKELGEVCVVKTGQQINKTFIQNNLGRYPVVNSGKEPLGFVNVYNTEDDPIGITSRGAGVGYVSWNEGKYFRGNLNYSSTIKDSNVILPKFLYYFLKNSFKAIENLCTFEGIPALNKSNLEMLKIPIPPLEIQQEIVQILDKFTEYVTELTAELTAELTERQKQYSFYRDKLLSFEDEVYQVEWKTLGEVLIKGRGTKITAGQMKSLHKEGAPVRIFAGGKTFADVNYGDIPDKDVHSEEAIIVKSRGIIDFEYYTKPFSFKNEFWSYSSENELINLKYVHYYLDNNKEHFQKIANNMQMPQISSVDTEKYKIPIPPLPIQQRIVEVLDNFDAVCNDLNIGLPKEIELRQKQYDYFREKLLTFTAEGVYTDSTVQYRQDLIRLLNWVFGTIRVELGAICTFTRGNGLQKKDFTEEGYPVIHYGQIYTRYGFSTDKTISFTDQSVFAKLKKAQSGDIVMATTSENVEDVGKAVVWEGNEEVGISGDAYIAKTTQHSRFLNYFFKSIHFQGQKEKKVTGTKVIRINAKDMEKFVINLPSLSTQNRIVAILDKFDELTTSIAHGLPKEIELRQKQYEYFRDQLLNFSSKHE